MANATQMENFTMEELWKDVRVRFLELTTMNLDLKPARTLDECIREIEKPKARSKSTVEETSKRERAKEYGIGILKCLKLLGGVAAQGAEMAFPPSSLCFNALSLLLDIPEKIHSFHSAVDGLLEEIGPSLSVFRIYEKIEQFNKIEPELKQAIHQVMISFIDICALSIKLRNSGRWRKFKVAVQLVLLENDSDVKGEVEHFKSLTAAHSSVQATQTLKVVLETNSSLATILLKASDTQQSIDKMAVDFASLRDTRKSEEERQGHLKNIKEKLGLKEDKVLQDSKNICDKHWKDSVRGTGAWIENGDEHSEFRDWAERDNTDANPIFLLKGDSNTGKSVLMSAIVHHLRSKYETTARPPPHTLVAYYFFPTLAGKEDEKKRPVMTALKCLALNLAEQDSAYAKSLSQACNAKADAEKFFRDTEGKTFWDILTSCLPKGKTAHYLLFDGLASLPDKYRDEREELLTILETLSQEQSVVRVILSVRPNTLGTASGLSCQSLDVEKHNAEDVRKYIDHDLHQKDMFQDLDEDSTRIRNNIRKNLTEKVGGNYYKVKAALDKIKAVVDTDEDESAVDRVLDESNKDEKEISRTLINKLEETLQARDIDELNELLTWVKFGKRKFSLDQLKAALFLRFQKRPMLQLEKKLRGKYADIFNILPGGFVDIADGMNDLLTKDRTQPKDVDGTPKFTATISITKANLTSVQSFLWNFMQKAAQDNFGFQQLVDQNSVKGSIGVNEFDANLTIVRRTFAILQEAPDQRTQPLASYLLNLLPQHLDILEKATGIDALTSSEKEYIGDGLFSLFFSGEVIERHWDSCDALYWYETPSEIETFRRWLEDPSVIRRLGRLDRQWLREVATDSNPNQALLFNVTKMIGRHWLRDRKWDAYKPFDWLRGFLSLPPAGKPVEADPASDSDTDSDSDMASSSAEVTVEMAVKWCREVLGDITPDGLWYERLGETYKNCGDYANAIEAFNSAIKFGDPGPKCHEGLAKALAWDDRYLEACLAMENALEILETQQPPDKGTLTSIYTSLSEWYTALQQPNRAIEYIQRAIGLAPDDHMARYGLLKHYLTNGYTEKAIEVLEELTNGGHAGDEPSLLDSIINEIVYDSKNDEVVARCFAAVSSHKELFQRLLQGLDRAISAAEKNEQSWMLAVLLYYKGVAVYHYRQHEIMPAKSAITYWTRCLDVSTEWGMRLYYMRASTLMSGHHFDQAMTSGDRASQEKHVEKLKAIVARDSPFVMSNARSFLTSYYTLRGDLPSARAIIQGCIDSAFEMLSDGIDDNDWEGYYQLAPILMHCGDDLNALSAYCMLLPASNKSNVMTWLLDFDEGPEQSLSLDLIATMEKELKFPTRLTTQIDFILGQIEKRLSEPSSAEDNADETRPTTPGAYEEIRSRLSQVPRGKVTEYFTSTCDGPCGRMWDFNTAMNACKYCYDRDFCDGCLAKLKEGKLQATSVRGLVCNRNHDWLRRPKWDKRGYLEALEGNVMVGGTMSEGARVGGELSTVAAWQKELKGKWGSPKVEGTKEETGQVKEANQSDEEE